MTGIDRMMASLVNELVSAVQQREAGEPDMPVWEAEQRVRRAEAALVTFYRGYMDPVETEESARRESIAATTVVASSASVLVPSS